MSKFKMLAIHPVTKEEVRVTIYGRNYSTVKDNFKWYLRGKGWDEDQLNDSCIVEAMYYEDSERMKEMRAEHD